MLHRRHHPMFHQSIHTDQVHPLSLILYDRLIPITPKKETEAPALLKRVPVGALPSDARQWWVSITHNPTCAPPSPPLTKHRPIRDPWYKQYRRYLSR